MHICLVTSRLPPTRCGVGDYCVQLGRELVRRGHRVTFLTGRDQSPIISEGTVRNTLTGWGLRGGLVSELSKLRADEIWLQWVPFLYSRRGTNLALPLLMIALRLMGYRIQIMVHEPWAPFDRWPYYITGWFHRLALLGLFLASQRVAVSITEWVRLLRTRFPWKREDIFWAPPGSNIPFIPLSRETLKKRKASLFPASILIGHFSPLGSGKEPSWLEPLWHRLKSDERLRLIIIGIERETLAQYWPLLASDPKVFVTGYLSPQEVSHWFQLCDLMVAPFLDGVSSRRTSVISAMEHGMAIISTRGRLTDTLFDSSPLILVPPHIPDLAEAILGLSNNEMERLRRGQSIRRFYDQHFSWSIIASLLLREEPSHFRERLAR